MNIKIQIQRRFGVFKRVIERGLLKRSSRGTTFWKSLNLAQRCYAAATLVYFSELFFDIQGVVGQSKFC